MNKTIITLALIIFSVNSYCQDRIVTAQIKPDREIIREYDNYIDTIIHMVSYYNYIGIAVDTISENQESLSIDVKINKHYGTGYNLNTIVMPCYDNSKCIIKYQGRIFSSESWEDIPKYDYNLCYYRYIRCLIINVKGKSKLNSFEIKLWIHE